MGAFTLQGQENFLDGVCHPSLSFPPPCVEGIPAIVTHQADMIEIVHAGATERAVGHRKSGRLDDMRLHAQTGAEPKNRSSVLRNVGLEQSNAHGRAALDAEMTAQN